MKTAFFTLLSDRGGYKFATFETREERKIIDGFDKIPYTPETLLEDILSGFSAFPDCRKSGNRNNTELESSIQWHLTAGRRWDDDSYEKYPFSELVFIKTYDNVIHCYVNAEKNTNVEIYFYKQLLSTAKEAHNELEVYLSVVPVDEFIR